MSQPPGGAGGGPTALRMLLGSHLRRLREAQGISRETAGWEIRASESKISRMELGRVSFKERDVADLLTLYGVDDEEERTRLLGLVREANTPGWWHREGDILPGWFQSYLGLEASASLIRTYEIQFVPGLLQTPEYARSVIILGNRTAPPWEIDRRVALRMRRQELLRRDRPPTIWVVIDEAALRRPIGGSSVMAAQIAHLADVAKLTNVRIQVIPFVTGGHAAAGGAFTVLRFPEPDLSDVVYIEQMNSALYLDKPEDVDFYTAMIEQLCIQAEPPARTPEILDEILRDFKAQAK
ncbi:MAG TPA: helix-turn-helix transcriptional regulator [Jiangellaceae bacterium]|nr:helix-turn-helix transcriptional regulator [Jiangellaceae bacterium]